MEQAVELSLERLRDTFQACVAEAMEAMLGKCSTPMGDWSVLPRLQSDRAINCSVGHANDEYQGVCLFALRHEDLVALVPSEDEAALRLDALCELANGTIGALLARPEFLKCFGYVIPCVPCMNEGEVRYPKATALQGCMDFGSGSLLFGFAVRRNPSFPRRG